MIQDFLKTPDPFLARPRKSHIPVILLTEAGFKTWVKKQKAHIKTTAQEGGFKGQPKRICLIRGAKGQVESVLAGVSAPISLYDAAAISAKLKSEFSDEVLKNTCFGFEQAGKDALEKLHIGWALGLYKFDAYKAEKGEAPALLWSKGVDKKRVQSLLGALCMLRNLVNLPANDLGPENMEFAARKIAALHQAKVKVITGQKLLDENFPLIHTVGEAGHEAPRLIEITWGKKSDPKVTLVGKGVTFDTGGLNIKPAQYMRLMKKDMGGAAHVLALGRLIMDAGLKVNLKILIPAVENAISANAFRPGDIIKSRKGLTVENTNTDAEGRLILADALTYACEDTPELLIDYATLTGSARAAFGPDIPPFVCTSDKTAAKLQKLGMEVEDPVWQVPLWEPYKKYIQNSISDLVNSANPPGDLIYSALFLKSFLSHNPEWLHFDIFSWEQTGFAGRPQGGADTGLRSVFALLEERYG